MADGVLSQAYAVNENFGLQREMLGGDIEEDYGGGGAGSGDQWVDAEDWE